MQLVTQQPKAPSKSPNKVCRTVVRTNVRVQLSQKSILSWRHHDNQSCHHAVDRVLELKSLSPEGIHNDAMNRFVVFVALIVVVDLSCLLEDRYFTTEIEDRSFIVKDETNHTIHVSENATIDARNATSRIAEIEVNITESSKSNPPESKNLWQGGVYDGALCPGMLEVAHFMTNSTQRKLNVTMFQLVGVWSDPEASGIYHNVYRHNARISARHGYTSVAITNTSRWATHPAFAKMLAVRDHCVEAEPGWRRSDDEPLHSGRTHMVLLSIFQSNNGYTLFLR